MGITTHVKMMWIISPKTPLCSSKGCSDVSHIVFSKHSSPLNPDLKIFKIPFVHYRNISFWMWFFSVWQKSVVHIQFMLQNLIQFSAREKRLENFSIHSGLFLGLLRLFLVFFVCWTFRFVCLCGRFISNICNWISGICWNHWLWYSGHCSILIRLN